MSDKDLKPGWKRWRFDQMAINVNDRIANPAEADVEHYIGLEHLDTDSLKIRRWGAPTDVEATKLRFRKGDIIFGRRRAYQRKLAVAEFDGICSAHAMVLRAKTDVVLPEFLPFFMQSDLFMNRALEISVGSLSPTINWKTMAIQEFTLPPPEEQRRIVELLQSVEQNLEAIQELEAALEQLRKSFIVSGFSKVLQDDATQIVKVSQAGDVLMGRQRAPQYDQGISPRPYLRVANVFDGYIDTSDVKQMDFSENEFKQYRLEYGDVLLVEGHSSAEVVGRSSIFRNEVIDCCLQNTLIRFRAKLTKSGYAHHYFQYCLYTGRFSGVAKQTTIAHLGSNRFASMDFPIPSPDFEQEIVTTLASIETNIRETTKRKENANRLKTLLFESELSGKNGDGA